MKQSTFNKIARLVDREDFLASVFSDYLDRDDVEWITDVDDIERELESKDAFTVDIIYYNNAIKYLAEHDPSLSTALMYASDYGYSVRDLNSEILASILATENARISWSNLRDQIEDILYSEED